MSTHDIRKQREREHREGRMAADMLKWCDKCWHSWTAEYVDCPICIKAPRASGNPASALDAQVAGDHYRDMKIQPVEFIQANGIGYIAGNVIKYVSRYKAKNGEQDLLKARHYIDLLLELEYSGKPRKWGEDV